MADPLRHRQTKGGPTDMVDLTPPRHIPTLPLTIIVGFLRYILRPGYRCRPPRPSRSPTLPVPRTRPARYSTVIRTSSSSQMACRPRTQISSPAARTLFSTPKTGQFQDGATLLLLRSPLSRSIIRLAGRSTRGSPSRRTAMVLFSTQLISTAERSTSSIATSNRRLASASQTHTRERQNGLSCWYRAINRTVSWLRGGRQGGFNAL